MTVQIIDAPPQSIIDLRKTNSNLVEKMNKWFAMLSAHIFPGGLIKREMLEHLFGCEYSEKNWRFRECVILLRQKIKSAGYFTEDKGCEPPEFKIVESQNMAAFAKKRLLKNMISNYEVAYVMAAHDKSHLTEDQKKIHQKVQMQAADAAAYQQRVLLSNTLF